MGTSLCPKCFTSHPADCLWPGEAVKDRKCLKDLRPYTNVGDKEGAHWLWALDCLRSGHCGHLASEAADGRFYLEPSVVA